MNVAARLDDRSLATRSARMAALVRRRGVRPGDCVAVMLPRGPELAVAFYGVLRAGAVVAPLDPGLDADAVRGRLEAVAARLLVAWHGVAEVAEAAASDARTEVVFVAPGEFERLLASAEPARDVADRTDRDDAVVLLGAVYSHGDLARADEPLAVFG